MNTARPANWIAVAGFLLLTISVSAGAAPAAWFLWQSTVDGALTCKQASPGRGWKKVAGPYEDARCSKPVRSTRPESTAQA